MSSHNHSSCFWWPVSTCTRIRHRRLFLPFLFLYELSDSNTEKSNKVAHTCFWRILIIVKFSWYFNPLRLRIFRTSLLCGRRRRKKWSRNPFYEIEIFAKKVDGFERWMSSLVSFIFLLFKQRIKQRINQMNDFVFNFRREKHNHFPYIY